MRRPPLMLLLPVLACGPMTGEADAGTELQRGEHFLIARGCSDCHREADGTWSGHTTPLLGTQIFPANLTPDPDSGIGGWMDDEIAYAIREGFAPGFVELCAQMSRFDHVGDDEVLAMIAFLRAQPPVARTIPRSTCPPIRP